MRILLVSLIFFSSFSEINAQGINRATLANYSYIIGGYKAGNLSSSGTGFIIHYLNKDFLVTCYHVLTGKNPSTGQLMPNATDTNKSITIFFTNKVNNGYAASTYPLFQKTHIPLFYTYNFLKGGKLDLAILPIILPTDALVFTLDSFNCDTTFRHNSFGNIIVAGFPGYPAENYGRITIKRLVSIRSDDEVSIYYSDTTAHGMSGSPIYWDSPLQLTAINAGYNIYDLHGNGIYIGYAFRIIKGIYKNSSVAGTPFRK